MKAPARKHPRQDYGALLTREQLERLHARRRKTCHRSTVEENPEKARQGEDNNKKV